MDTSEVAQIPAADVVLDQLGFALAAVHRLPPPVHPGPKPGWWREPLPEGRVGELVASAGRASAPWAPALAAQASALEELRHLVLVCPVPHPTVLCHLDANRAGAFSRPSRRCLCRFRWAWASG